MFKRIYLRKNLFLKYASFILKEKATRNRKLNLLVPVFWINFVTIKHIFLTKWVTKIN